MTQSAPVALSQQASGFNLAPNASFGKNRLDSPESRHRSSSVFIATHAAQQLAQMRLPSGYGHDPWPQLPRRTMAHMLSVSAGELGDPVALLVLVISDNWLLCHLCRNDSQ